MQSVHSLLYVRAAKLVKRTNERIVHRGGVYREFGLEDLGHHESYQSSLPPPLSAQIPSFLLLLLSTSSSSSTPSSVYPAVGVWKWTRASDDVILVTPMCALKCDMLLCPSTCSCASSMSLELHELDSANVGVAFSINSAETGGNLSHL